MIVSICALGGFYCFFSSHSGSGSAVAAGASRNVPDSATIKLIPATEPSPTPKDWSDCSANPAPNKSSERSGKLGEPLWLPAYPTSLPGVSGFANPGLSGNAKIYEQFISRLTGFKSGANNYYRSHKKLKKCHSTEPNDPGVTCEIVHPLITTNPWAQSKKFGKEVLIALRNPLSAFPAYHQDKAFKYHGAKGQVSREEWRKFRDEYVADSSDATKLFAEWKKYVLEWRSMDPYRVAMYLPYERWHNENTGPELVLEFSRALERGGFPVLFEGRELECLWYETVYKALLKEKEKCDKDGWYVPDYTNEQREMLADQLETFAKEIESEMNVEGKRRNGDEELVAILREYKEDIKGAVG